MNNDNVVKIGTALKWRSTFDLTKKYYQENIVTDRGCVFRCKVLQAQGKPPLKVTDEEGHIAYINTDVWDVVVDMAYYYNYALDAKVNSDQTLELINDLANQFKKDKDAQWERIKAIEKVNADQQFILDSLLTTISCFSEGSWFDNLLWSNEALWDNNKYILIDELQNQIDELAKTHLKDIDDLSTKHNSEIKALQDYINQREEHQNTIHDFLQNQIDKLNNLFSCFSTGVWENDLFWSQTAPWSNTNQIDSCRCQTIPVEVPEYAGCFEYGKWENLFLWSDSGLWYNSIYAQDIVDIKALTDDELDEIISEVAGKDYSVKIKALSDEDLDEIIDEVSKQTINQ